MKEGIKMILFNSDYTQGACPEILQRLLETNMEQTSGYGEDEHCKQAIEYIKRACGRTDLQVHFLVGGTQTNFTFIASALRPHQGVLTAETGHINVHETGAVEATGHKVLTLPSKDGKISASEIQNAVILHRNDESFEHIVQPKMVYLSFPTELGTLYSKKELEEIAAVCQKEDLILYVDGARMGYGLMSPENDLTLEDFSRLCDAFYIGGTKVGALFGEALIISNRDLGRDFRYLIKQKGGLLAKGRLLGIQFETLFTNHLYEKAGKQGIEMADRLRKGLAEMGIPLYVNSPTNQIFPVLSDCVISKLEKEVGFSYLIRIDESHSAVRFCTCWATTEEQVDTLLAFLNKYIGE